MREPLSRRSGDGLRHTAGVALLAVIVAAPWMYGSTRHWAIIALCWMLSATVLLWAVGCGLSGRMKVVPALVGFPVLFLLFGGWLMVLAGSGLPLEPFTTEHLRGLIRRWPASFVVKTPIETMWLFTGLLGALLVVVDLSAQRRWWIAIYTTMALAGASIVLLGLVQIQTGAEAILWQRNAPNTGNFFATYFHHSLAGAFINLVWPLAAGGFLFCLKRTDRDLWRVRLAAAFWGLILLVDLCGPLAQVSRVGHLNALVLILLFAAWAIWRKTRMRATFGLRVLAAAVAFLLVVGAVAAGLGRLPEIGARWRLFSTQNPAPKMDTASLVMRPDGFIEATESSGFLGARTTAAKVCLRMMPSAGLLGFGPGTWSATYPHFTEDPLLRTFFLHIQFAHTDWLQTVVEWGILGALAWGILIAGGLWQAIRLLRHRRSNAGSAGAPEGMVAGVLVALTGVLLHALVDFPLQIPSIQLYFIVLLGLAWRSASPAGVEVTTT